MCLPPLPLPPSALFRVVQHITVDEPAPKRRRAPRQLAVAEAHITADPAPAAPRARRAREMVVAEAHITADPAPAAPRARRAREMVVADAHITVPEPVVRTPKVKPERVLEDVVVVHNGKRCGREGEAQHSTAHSTAQHTAHSTAAVVGPVMIE